MKHFLPTCLIFFALFIVTCCVLQPALADIPADSLKVIPMVNERSVSTFIPSQSAPAGTSAGTSAGLAVNIIYPEKIRYPDGAPVVVVVPGGDGPNGLNFCIHAAQVGFIEIRFAFPGGGASTFRSSGKSDYRGKASQAALKDVLLFALGQKKDYQKRSISELIPVKTSSKNVGLVGWSNGGNIALVTMDKYSEELAPIAWAAFYECPLGPLFFPSSLGGTNDLLLNRHYRLGSAATGRCLIDFRKLAYDPTTVRNPGIHKKLGEPDIPGVVYFDENGNKLWDESSEFAFNYCLDRGVKKQIYPPEITSALERHNVFATGWPGTLAEPKDSEAYFQERDGSACIPSICSKYPQLLVTVYGSHIDHLQRQPDHPHIVLQYNAWLDNGVHWVRLNPEPIYLSQIANMGTRNFVSNKPNDPIDATAIADHLEQEGMLKEYVFIDATIAELADRKRTGNLSSPLEQVLVTYSNGLSVPSAGAGNASGQPKASQGTPATQNK